MISCQFLRYCNKPININETTPEEYQLITEPSPLKNILYRFFSRFNKRKSNFFVQNLSNSIFSRIEEYVKCIEFNTVLDIPPDFQIELIVLSVHVWAILNRLNDFQQNSLIVTLKHYLMNILYRKVENEVGALHINRKGDLILDSKHYIDNCIRFFNYHFRGNLETVDNNIYKLDSLVWTSVFLEKMDRYDRRIYLFSGYLLELVKAFEKKELEDFLRADLDINVFMIPFDYEEQLKKVNPPLSRDQLKIEQSKSKNSDKKYRYDYKNANAPIPANITQSKTDNFTSNLKKKTKYIFKKYYDLDSYDFFSQKEEKSEEIESRKKKYPWNSDLKDSVMKEIRIIEAVRSRRAPDNN